MEQYGVSRRTVYMAIEAAGVATGRYRLSDEQREEIVMHYALGVAPSELAKMYGVSTTSIYETLKRAGIKKGKRRIGKARPRLLTAAEEQEVIEASKAGMVDRQIAEAMGVSRSTIVAVRKRHQLPASGASGRGRPKLSDETLRGIRAAYEGGSSVGDIAEAFGVKRGSIPGIVRRMGGEVRPRSHWSTERKGRPQPQVHLVSAEDMEYLSRLYRQGASLKELAEVADVSKATMWQMFVKYGYARRPPSYRPQPGEHLISGLEPQLVEDYLSGMSESQLVEKYAITPREVREAVDRHFGAWMRKAQNPDFDAPIGLLAATSVATLAFGIWGWAKRAR
jgi:transposase